MSHGMVLFSKLPHDGWLHEQQAQGRWRASMTVADGPFQAIGMRVGEPGSYRAMSTTSCPEGSICDPYEVLNILTSRVSMGIPQEAILFAHLHVPFGQRLAFQRLVREQVDFAQESGAYLAAAHLFGRGPYNAALEIMADHPDTVLELLLRTTDLPGLGRVDLSWVDHEATQGMGATALPAKA